MASSRRSGCGDPVRGAYQPVLCIQPYGTRVRSGALPLRHGDEQKPPACWDNWRVSAFVWKQLEGEQRIRRCDCLAYSTWHSGIFGAYTIASREVSAPILALLLAVYIRVGPGCCVRPTETEWRQLALGRHRLPLCLCRRQRSDRELSQTPRPESRA